MTSSLYFAARLVKSVSRTSEQFAGWLHGIADKLTARTVRNRSIIEINP